MNPFSFLLRVGETKFRITIWARQGWVKYLHTFAISRAVVAAITSQHFDANGCGCHLSVGVMFSVSCISVVRKIPQCN